MSENPSKNEGSPQGEYQKNVSSYRCPCGLFTTNNPKATGWEHGDCRGLWRPDAIYSQSEVDDMIACAVRAERERIASILQYCSAEITPRIMDEMFAPAVRDNTSTSA
jgi:hypothetical protein